LLREKELKDLFHDTLKDIYFAEKKILSALPKMARAAQSPKLKAAFEKHMAETDGQVERLEQVFASIDETPKGKTCDAIMGIIEEGNQRCLSNRSVSDDCACVRASFLDNALSNRSHISPAPVTNVDAAARWARAAVSAAGAAAAVSELAAFFSLSLRCVI
jgi:hypothetical protein